MPVDEIIKRIKQAAQRKVKNIEKRKEEKAEEIEQEIEREKDRKLDQIRKEKEREIDTTRNRIISQAKLDARKNKLQAREEMIEKIFDQAMEELDEAYPDDYEDYLRKAIGKASNILEGDSIAIHCNPESEEKVEELVSKIAPSLDVKSDLDVIGGIKAVSDSGSEIDLTFEASFERKKKELRKDISDMLFAED